MAFCSYWPEGSCLSFTSWPSVKAPNGRRTSQRMSFPEKGSPWHVPCGLEEYTILVGHSDACVMSCVQRTQSKIRGTRNG